MEGGDKRNNHLVKELVSTDGHLGNILRTIYEHSSEESTQQFVSSLDRFVEKTDEEIEKICNRHYQGFTDSIDDLLRVKTDADDLNIAVQDTKASLCEQGEQMATVLARQIELRRTQVNLLTTAEVLQTCLPVVRLYCKAVSQLKSGRFYSALKLLQELESLHLTPDMTFGFCQKIRERVPEVRQQVKAASFVELQAFLADIRGRNLEIGQAAIMHTQRSESLSSAAETNGLGTSEGSDDDELSAADMADFSALYRCLHICDVLSARKECEKYYKVERRKQAMLVIEPPVVSGRANSENDMQTYSDFLYRVAGFFLIEDTALSTTDGLLSRQWVDELWAEATTQVVNVLTRLITACMDEQVLLWVKNLVLLFSQTLQAYDYECGRLFVVLSRTRDQYTTAMFRRCKSCFEAALSSDQCVPILINNKEEYDANLKTFPFNDRVFNQAPFPKAFPFSLGVPNIYDNVLRFIDDTSCFIEGLDLSVTEMSEIVVSSTNHLLRRILAETLSTAIREGNLSLQQLAQVSVNTTHLEDACVALETHISLCMRAQLENVKLHGTSVFKDARNAIEEKIREQLSAKIDDFLQEHSYDWCPAEANLDPETSPVFDLLGYLTTVFASLNHLPTVVAHLAHLSTCKYIYKQLRNAFDTAIAYNLEGLRGFLVEVELCEEYASDFPGEDVESEHSQLCRDIFSPLKNILTLILDWDWPAYVASASQESEDLTIVPVEVAYHALSRVAPPTETPAATASSNTSPSKLGRVRSIAKRRLARKPKLTVDGKKLKQEKNAILKQLRSVGKF